MEDYYNPVEIVFGSSSLNQIGKIVEKHKLNKKILIISDIIMRELGVIQRIEAILENNDNDVRTFEEVSANPTFRSVDEATLFARRGEYGLIIGLGGGSSLDCAKCAAILSKNKGKISDYLINDKEITNSGIPFIAIPTTAGTGSEVTMWATVWRDVDDFKKKYSMSDKKMYAKASIIDPELTLSLPPYLTATTGLDALSQAIEAYWSRNHNPTSDKHALEAIPLIFSNIEKAFKDPSNLEFREKMIFGSLESGLAFSNTKTTAVHSVSYPITALYNVPHGLACALTLGSFLVFNSKSCNDNLPESPDRIVKIVECLNSQNALKAKEEIENLMKKMNLPTKLSELGVDENGIELIIKEGFTKGRIENNPRKVTKNDLYKILTDLL